MSNELSIITIIMIGLANAAVGGCIGICGIAGFLLPMLYSGALGFDVTYALALSFLAFLVSGLIGSANYYRAGNLDVSMSLKLGAGSLIGAVAGVFLQSLIEKKHSQDPSLSCSAVIRIINSYSYVEREKERTDIF